MSLRNTASRYGSLSIGLHWLMVLLIAAVYACIELRENFPKGSDLRDGLKTWHFMLGLGILVLALFRLAARLTDTVPGIEPAPPRWQALLAKLAHVALYVLMIGMPLAGWMILSAEGKPIPFFGLDLPPLIMQSKAVAEWANEIHETGGNVGYFVIGLHSIAALYHHYFLRDNTLRRMLPRRG